MTHEQFRRIAEAFDELAAMPAAERVRLAEKRFSGEPELRDHLLALLAEHDRIDSPVATARGLDAAQRSLAAMGIESARRVTTAELLPVLKGAYRLLRVVGEGGMGVVYEAEQAFPRRRVAIKSIRPGYATPAMLRRFKTEVELLARLDHPGIAQVYEAGYADEASPAQAFLVMELVDGLPLHRYALVRGLSVRERLELLLRVCDAVQHAHQRGVIHRDLKPANILVTSDGQPKVLDFGIARAIDEPGDATHATRAGQVVGTPSYMSPEQLLGEPVDTRTDVYALGVIAYELLSNELPYDLSKVPVSDAMRTVRESPATLLSRVNGALRGDVETIVSTAMHLDRARRYASVAAMSDDIRSFLDDRPIHARRDSAVDVLSKFAKRHTALVTLGFAFLAAIVAFGVVSSALAAKNARLARESDQARARAEAEATRNADLSRSLQDEVFFARLERGRAEATAGKLKLAEDTLWKEYLARPDRTPARWALAEMYAKMPCVWTVQGDTTTVAAAVSLDGRHIALGTSDGVLVVRSAVDGRELWRTEPLGAAVTALAITPGGSWIGLGLQDGRAALLAMDASARPEFFACDEGSILHARGVLTMAFSGDDRSVAMGGSDRRVSLWDASTRVRRDVFEAHLDPVAIVTLSGDGSIVATCGRGVAEGRKIWRKHGHGWSSQDIPTRPNDHISWMQFDRDDTLLFAFTGNQVARVRIDSMEVTNVVPPLGGRVFSGAFSPDHHQLAIGAAQTPFLCASQAGTPARSLGQQASTIIAVGWSGSSRVVTVGEGGEIRAFDARGDIPLMRLEGFPSWCFSVAWSTDGSLLGVNAGGVALSTYDGASGTLISSAALPSPARQRAMRFVPGTSTLIAGGADGRLRVVDVKRGVITRTLGSPLPEVFSLAMLPDQRTVISGHADGVIRVWDVEREQVLREMPKLARRVESLALTPDGGVLASTGSAGDVQLWDVATWEDAGSLATTAPPWGMAFSPDGGTLYVSTHAGTLEVFDWATRTRRSVIAAHQRLIPGLAASPDGTLIATSSEDGSVRLWDAVTLRHLTSFELNAAELVHLAFDSTSRYLAVGAARRQAIVIDLQAMDRAIEGNRAFHEARFAK